MVQGTRVVVAAVTSVSEICEEKSAQNYLLVFAGGGIGAAARYWLSGLVYQRLGSEFPSGSLIVNVIGCFLIGLLMSVFDERFVLHPSLQIFLTIGILGGFTTFSNFIVVELVDTEEDCRQFLPRVDGLIEQSGSGVMVTIEKAEIIRYSAGKK